MAGGGGGCLPEKVGAGEAPASTQKQSKEVGEKAKDQWDPASQVKKCIR